MPPGEKKGPPRHVAVKVFNLESGNRDKDRSSSKQADVKGHPDFFKAEWEMLAQLEHPHIVRMYECFQEPTALYIVMELCLGGELIEHVKEVSRRRGRGGLEEADARHLFRQMLYAGSYLHAQKIVHRDIKLENFLLVGAPETAGASAIKLCDFGTAVILTDRMPRAYGRIGTLSYTSPEVCADRGATVLADAWSLGVVLYVLLVGAKPFRLKLEEPREETMRRIQAGSYNQARPTWRTLTADSRDLVKSLITVEEASRLGSSDALLHPWAQLDAPNLAVAHRWGDVAGAAPNALKLLAHATRMDPLQQFVMSLLARLISEASLLQKSGVFTTWYNLFYALDANKDGQLDFTELARGLWTMLGPSARMSSAQLAILMRALDLNTSGAIEWTEWAAVALLAAGGITLEDELLATGLRLLGLPRSADGSFEEEDTNNASSLSSLVPSNPQSSDDRLLSTLPPERVKQLRERFEAWVPRQEPELANGNLSKSKGSKMLATNDLCMDDLREVLASTAWFPVDRPLAGNRASPPIHENTEGSDAPPAVPALALPPRDTFAPPTASPFSSPRAPGSLAASPFPSPREEPSLAASPMPSPRDWATSVSPLSSPRGTMDRSVPKGPMAMPTARCRVPGTADLSPENSEECSEKRTEQDAGGPFPP